MIFQLRDLLSSGEFHLTKFLSNQREVVDSVPPDCRANSLKDISFNELPTEKTLGVYWDAASDCFKIEVKVVEKPATRRGILSMVSQVLEPLGFVQPFALPIKKLLQEACYDKLSWDEEIG